MTRAKIAKNLPKGKSWKDSGRLKLAAKGIITALLVIFILRTVSAQDLVHQFHSFDWLSLVPTTLFAFMFLLLGGINNWLVMKAVSPLSLGEALKFFFISASVGMFTPAYVGEFASMTYLLKQKGVDVSKGLAVPTIDKMITLAANVILFVIGLLLYFPETGQPIFIVAGASLIVPALLLYIPASRAWSYQLIQRRFSWAASYCHACASFFVHHPLLFAANFMLSFLRAAVGGMCIWFLLRGFGLDAKILDVLFVNFVVRIVSFVPLTINGLGLLEGTAMVLFRRIDVSSELSFLAFFMARLVGLGIGLVVVLWVTWVKPRDPLLQHAAGR